MVSETLTTLQLTVEVSFNLTLIAHDLNPSRNVHIYLLYQVLTRYIMIYVSKSSKHGIVVNILKGCFIFPTLVTSCILSIMQYRRGCFVFSSYACFCYKLLMQPGRVAHSVTCLTADTRLYCRSRGRVFDPGLVSYFRGD